jgi:dipeptidyl aminopeptidase/acylaminoacyl peptidase
MTRDPDALLEGVRQGVMDVRRAARWLASLPEVDADRIGICGVSLGGFVAATAAGVDGRFPRVGIVLAGGDLASVLAGESREVRGFREAFRTAGLGPEEIRARLAPIEPLTYAARLRSARVLMLNATRDEIVPAAGARRLAGASGADQRWFRAGHYTMAMWLPWALEDLVDHFTAPAGD